MVTQNIIIFERPTKDSDTLFDYNSQEGPKRKFLNITIIQSEHGIIIYQTDHIIKNTIQEYWEHNTKE